MKKLHPSGERRGQASLETLLLATLAMVVLAVAAAAAGSAQQAISKTAIATSEASALQRLSTGVREVGAFAKGSSTMLELELLAHQSFFSYDAERRKLVLDYWHSGFHKKLERRSEYAVLLPAKNLSAGRHSLALANVGEGVEIDFQ